MKFLSFKADGRESFGVLTDAGIVDLSGRLADVGDLQSMISRGLLERARAAAAGAAIDFQLSDVELLRPFARGTRFFCIGVNYPERNEEYKDGSERPKYPSIFMRTHTSFVAHDEPLVKPCESEQLDYEGEIALIIGKSGRRIAQRDALSHLFGYTCANDGSVRDWLRHSKFNVTQGKNFDRSGSIGPIVVTADEVGSAPLRILTRVNGEVRQDDSSDRMIFGIAYLVHYLSSFCTLEPGDVILSGTPSGAGARFDPPRYLKAGDRVEVEISRIAVLRNSVVDDAQQQA